MSEHTPGPWVVDPANPNLVARDGDVYEYICEVAPSAFSDSTHSYDQECANARLIAAAPELLEALRKVSMNAVHVNYGECSLSYCVIREVDAAIKKAEEGK